MSIAKESYIIGNLNELFGHLANESFSASPLNGEAATLWDNDMEEFKKKVVARHRDITDDN